MQEDITKVLTVCIVDRRVLRLIIYVDMSIKTNIVSIRKILGPSILHGRSDVHLEGIEADKDGILVLGDVLADIVIGVEAKIGIRDIRVLGQAVTVRHFIFRVDIIEDIGTVYGLVHVQAVDIWVVMEGEKLGDGGIPHDDTKMAT